MFRRLAALSAPPGSDGGTSPRDQQHPRGLTGVRCITVQPLHGQTRQRLDYGRLIIAVFVAFLDSSFQDGIDRPSRILPLKVLRRAG
jgi:hypothetical protein